MGEYDFGFLIGFIAGHLQWIIFFLLVNKKQPPKS